MNRLQPDRLNELLADEALAALDAEHHSELEAMLSQSPEAERDALMRTAALTQLAFLQRDRSAPQPMPAGLRARLLSTAATLQTTDTQGG